MFLASPYPSPYSDPNVPYIECTEYTSILYEHPGMNCCNQTCFRQEILNSLKGFWYQFVHILDVILSFLGAALIIYFLIKRFYSVAAHKNVKLLMFAYFASIVVSCIVFVISQTYEIVVALAASTPCDLGVSPEIHRPVFRLNVFCLLTQAFLQFSLVIERTVATIYVKTYESANSVLGYVLFIFSIGLSVCMVFGFIQSSDFIYYKIDILTAPKVSFGILFLLTFGIIIGILSVFIMAILACVNSKRQAQIQELLTRKYQRGENIRTTQFSILIVGIHCTMQALYAGGQLALITDITKGMSYDLYANLQQAVYLYPYMSVILPISAVIQLKSLRMKNERRRDKIISLPTTGQAASDYYNNMLYAQWQEKRT